MKNIKQNGKKTIFSFQKNLKSIFALFFLMTCVAVDAQVGISNVSITPDASSMLEVRSTSKGLLIPRVALTGTSDVTTVVSAATSLLVYNTATVSDVTPGFYFWSGAAWVRLLSGTIPASGWALTGNAGTISGTNFVGTTDAQALDFRTNNTLQFRISTGGQLQANNLGTAAAPVFTWVADNNTGVFSPAADIFGITTSGTERYRFTTTQGLAGMDGSAAAPMYSWNSDNNNGMYRIGADILGFATNGTERFRLSTTEAVVNDASNNYDFRVESDGQDDMFFVDASANRIGFNTVTPANVIDFRATTEDIWLTYWENANAATGAVAQFYHSNVANGNRVVMGVTNYDASALEADALIGLSLNSTVTGTGGTGVYGGANNESGIAVYGSLFNDGTYSGWAGYFDADVYVGGTLYEVSDRRLKSDIEPMQGGLDVVMKMKPVSFSFNKQQYPEMGLKTGLQYGFIAQDVEEVIPTLVKEKTLSINSNRLKTTGMNSEKKSEVFKVVDYTGMIPFLTKAIQEQQVEIESLEARIKALEEVIKANGQ